MRRPLQPLQALQRRLIECKTRFESAHQIGAARDELASVHSGVQAGTYVPSSKLTLDEACEGWLVSKHSLKPSTLRGHRVSLGPLRDELGHVPVQQLTKADIDAWLARIAAIDDKALND